MKTCKHKTDVDFNCPACMGEVNSYLNFAIHEDTIDTEQAQTMTPEEKVKYYLKGINYEPELDLEICPECGHTAETGACFYCKAD